jgi:integrase
VGSQASKLIEVGSNGDIQIWKRLDQKTPQFYCRVWLPQEARENRRNPYKRKALGTQDLQVAKDMALEFAADVRAKVRTKESIFTVSFQKAANQFIKDLEARLKTGEIPQNKLKRNQTSIERYLIPYFKDKSIDAIDGDALEGFLKWRRDYYTSGPGRAQTYVEFLRNGKKLQRPLAGSRIPAGSTLAKDLVSISLMLDFAKAKRWISRKPDMPKLKIVSNRRPDFSSEDQERILGYFRAMDSKDGITMKDRERTSRTVNRSWALLEYFVRFMLITGVRVQEAHGLKWKHIELKDPIYNDVEWRRYGSNEPVSPENSWKPLGPETRIRVRIPRNLVGLKSPSHARIVIPTSNGFTIVEQLKSMYVVFDERTPQPEDPLFMHPNQTPIGSFRNAFGTLLDKLNLRKQDEISRSLTSLRHTYACNRLRRGTSVYVLCKNMGTSEAMIRDHYDHLIAEEFAESLED